jgi:hypothetical protein
MSVQLLDKTRKINKLLHNNNSHKVVFNDICLVLSEILGSNILVISKKGKVLGIKNREDITPIQELIQDAVGGYIDGILNETKLSGIGRFHFMGCSQLILNEDLSGYTLMYRAVHDVDGDDKIPPALES